LATRPSLDESGRPSFNALQNAVPPGGIFYYVFDVTVLGGGDVMAETGLRRARNTLHFLSPWPKSASSPARVAP